jgi:multidrug resistance efflux pump
VLAVEATLEEAELNLEFTRVRAPVNGYVTNLNLRLGTTASVLVMKGSRDSQGELSLVPVPRALQ